MAKLSNFGRKLAHVLNQGSSLVSTHTREWARMLNEMRDYGRAAQVAVVRWDVHNGFTPVWPPVALVDGETTVLEDGVSEDLQRDATLLHQLTRRNNEEFVAAFPNALEAVASWDEVNDATRKLPDHCVFLFQDCHYQIDEPTATRLIQLHASEQFNYTRDGQSIHHPIVFAHHADRLPLIDHIVVPIELPLLTADELAVHAIDYIGELAASGSKNGKSGLEGPAGQQLRDQLAGACAGLLLHQANDVLTGALDEANQFAPASLAIVRNYRRDIINAGGLLTVYDGSERFSQVGGLKALKEYALQVLGPRPAGSKANPRGMMLLGVSGAGKTMFARAAGGETGRMVIELDLGGMMGSLLGESVASHEELLFTDNRGILQRMTFAELHERGPEEYGTLACDNSNTHFVEGSSTIPHVKRTRDLLRVSLRSGREITVTNDHSLFTVDSNNTLQDILAGDLKPGDPIAIAGTLRFPVRNTVPLTIAEADRSDWYGDTTNFDKKSLSELVGEKSVSHYAKSGVVCLSRFDTAGNEPPQFARPTKRRFGEFVDIQSEYHVTTDDCVILGFWLANGDVNNGQLRIHVNAVDAESVQKVFDARWPTRRDPGKTENAASIAICGGAARFYRAVFGQETFEHVATTKRLPPFILQLPLKQRCAVLGAYLCGDGFFDYNAGEVATASRGLANDITLLAHTVGLLATIRPTCDNLHRVSFTGTRQFKRLQKLISFVGYTRKKVALNSALQRRRKSKNDRRGRRRPIQLPGKPFAIDRVERVDHVPATDDRVYDVNVPNLHKFLTGFGGVWAHNTEKNMRKAIDTVRASGRCILLIDEVEKALAGSQDGRSDGGVARRMLDVLLRFMNEPGDAVVICTSNDITSLPPEFTRPERFDKIAFFDLPTPAARTAMWETYKARFALPDQKLPDDTDWTGAEIAACSRMAALLNSPLADVAREITPVIKLNGDAINAQRKWAQDHSCSDADLGGPYMTSRARETTTTSSPQQRRINPRGLPGNN